MNFDAILKSSLAAVNDNYQIAVGEVQDVVNSVHTAVRHNAGNRYGLIFTEMSADIKGTTFRIYFDTNVDVMRARVIDVLFIRIPSTGYPIAIGTVDKATKNFFTEQNVNNKEELERVFAQLLQNPESSLIQAIGFALRTQDDDDDSPF
nr:hypothetical protein [Massilia sp. PDC64]